MRTPWDVLKTFLDSINLKSNSILNEDEWLCVACSFFITEWVVRRSQCHSTFEEHLMFEEKVIELLERKIDDFGITTSEQWYMMVVSENLASIKTKDSTDFTPYAVGALLCYLFQKL